MLKKLLKYEWKAVSGMNLLLAAIATGIALLGILYLQTPMWKNLMSGGNSPEDYFIGGSTMILWGLIGLGGIFVYVIMLIGVMLGQSIYLGVRYYTTMFSDQGYLTHTLPVTPRDLLITKVFVGGSWVFLISFLQIALIFALTVSAACGIGNVSLSELGSVIGKLLGEFLDAYIGQEQGGGILSMIALILKYLLTPFFSIAILYGALTLGHYSRKNKGLMGILAYFGVIFARSVLINLENICMGLIMRSMIRKNGYGLSAVNQLYFNSKNLSSFLVDILLSVLLMLWAHHILKNKLNME